MTNRETSFPEIQDTGHFAGREGFVRLMEENYASLFHYGTKFTRDHSLIKDCIQDLFLVFWERSEQMSGILSVKAYLMRSLRNNLVRELRNELRWEDLDNPSVDYDLRYSGEQESGASESEEFMAAHLKATLEKLPKRQREALYLRYYEGLSYEEIGEVMNLKRQAVANYLQYGLQKLRDYFRHALVGLAGVVADWLL